VIDEALPVHQTLAEVMYPSQIFAPQTLAVDVNITKQGLDVVLTHIAIPGVNQPVMPGWFVRRIPEDQPFIH
jgi:hypothetical protein